MDGSHPTQQPTTQEGVRVRGPGKRALLFAFLAYLAITIALTWPLARHLTDATPTYWGDTRTTVWILAWDAHVLSRDPTDLFQAPVFHPEPDALAYTEPNLTLALPAAPIIWATGNPYLAYNLLFLLAFPLSGLAAFLLSYELTLDRSAAFVSGAAFAFAPYWFGHIIASTLLKLVLAPWLPLAALGTIRWLRGRGVRWLAAASGSLVMAALQSWYVGVVTGIVIAITAVVVVLARQATGGRRRGFQTVAALTIAAALIVPYSLPYLRVRDRDPAVERPLAQQKIRSARASSYLSAPPDNTMYGSATRRWRAQQPSLESNLFPGIVVVLLAAGGAAALRRRTDRPGVLIALLITASGVVLSLGGAESGPKRFLPWSLLHETLPVFRSLGAPARSHVLTIMGLALLAAFGVRELLWKVRMRLPVAACLVLLMAFEGAALPRALGPAPKPEPIYRSLAGRPGGVLELPTITYDASTDSARVFGDPYNTLIYGSAHWRPLANGIPAQFPAGHVQLLEALEAFPDQRSMQLLRERNIRTLVVRTDLIDGSPWERIVERLTLEAGVALLAREGSIVVYDISPL